MATQKSETLETISSFETKITLSPEDFTLLANAKSANPKAKKVDGYKSIDSVISKKLKEQYEGKCSRSGYVLPNSVHLLSRSIGMVEKGRFTGDILFYVEASCKVYQPPEGVILAGTVTHKNRMGVYVNYDNHAIRIMVPRDLHIGEQAFDDIQIGDIVKVEIKKSRYQVNDASILSVGVFLGKADKAGYIGFDPTNKVQVRVQDEFVDLERPETPEEDKEQTSLYFNPKEVPAPADKVCKPEEGSDDIYFYADVFPENSYLDNFYKVDINIGGTIFKSIEHYIMTRYFEHYKNMKLKSVLLAIEDPVEVRKMVFSKEIKYEEEDEETGEMVDKTIEVYETKLNPNWEAERDGFMKTIQTAKFKQHKDLRDKLLATGDRKLVYADPADRYWGIGLKCDGANTIGKILMEVRDELVKNPVVDVPVVTKPAKKTSTKKAETAVKESAAVAAVAEEETVVEKKTTAKKTTAKKEPKAETKAKKEPKAETKAKKETKAKAINSNYIVDSNE